ncbi:MAG: hypothetical protein R2867_09635 [Caldilineaceae bacterium]
MHRWLAPVKKIFAMPFTSQSIAPVVLGSIDRKRFFWCRLQQRQRCRHRGEVFGSFITRREKEAPAFVIATANSVAHLPPELVRKGRFDEIFFVDLPATQERTDIWKIHLLKRNRNPAEFDLYQLALASEGLSGAEIEQAVIAGLPMKHSIRGALYR